MTNSVPPEELARVLTSKKVMAALLWVVSVVGTWGAAKLDTSKDIMALRETIQSLERKQDSLIKRIDDTIPVISGIHLEVDDVHHDVVVAIGVALAYETEKKAKEKLRAGDDLAVAYDNRRARGKTPAEAAQVFREVAVPHSAR
jgi:hypothetical protein